jgi:anti-anti-sigma regulatory factor
MAAPEPSAITLVIDADGLAADAETVDALARLALSARRSGLELRLRGASAELCELIELCGLDQVLVSGVEPRRQPEQREQPLGREEERQLRDPAIAELDDHQ